MPVWQPKNLTEGQVRLDPRDVRLVDVERLAGLPFALGALRRKEVTLARLRAQDLAGSRDFESFSYSFPRFTAGDGLRHKARKIRGIARMTTPLPGGAEKSLASFFVRITL